jgi:uncharacterized membrane protein
MRLTVLAAASILVLSACSQGSETPAPAVEAPEPAPVLAGVDLSQPVRALGTEPFWSLEFTGTELVYSTPEPPEQRAPQPKPAMQGTVAVFETSTAAGGAVKATLSATECSDGMSDRTYPLTAIVEIGGQTLTGCAASSAAIMTSGETGPVVENAAPAA